MSDFKLKISAEDVVKQIKEETDKVVANIQKDLQKSVKQLGKGALKEAEKLSSERLPTSLNNLYRDNLYMEQISDNIVEIGIREEALWIEEGRKGGFMDELLAKNAKVSKDGNKYKVIPMEKDTSAKKGSNSGQELITELKSFFKKEGVPYSKTRALELDDNGSPRIGKINSYDIKSMRDKNKKSVQSLSENLQGVSVYQNKNPKTGKVERNIMTFRVISEKSKEEGKWNHPGRKGEKILDETFKWVEKAWQTQILPDLKRKYESQ